METIDLRNLPNRIDDTVIKMVSLFMKTKVSCIDEAKTLIKTKLLHDQSSYVDYSTDFVNFCINIYETKNNDDFDTFSKLFLYKTMLLESVMNIKDDRTYTEMCQIISDLFNDH